MNNGLKEQLHDISIRTMIGQLPKIINDNNTKICDYIDKIYDSSSECITKNVDNVSDNKSYVKSNLGQFNSIFVGDFNLYNIKSLLLITKQLKVLILLLNISSYHILNGLYQRKKKITIVFLKFLYYPLIIRQRQGQSLQVQFL